MATTATGAAHARPGVDGDRRAEAHHEAKDRDGPAHHGISERLATTTHLAAAGAGGLRATTSLKSGSGDPPTIRSVLSTTKWS